MSAPRKIPLRWDIHGEHLSEAGFLWSQRERSLDSADYTLDEVSAGDEARLFAHLDALVLGGSAVAERLLKPSLESDDNTLVAAGAYALLIQPGRDNLHIVMERLQAGTGLAVESLLRALELCLQPEVSAQMLAILPDAPLRLQTALIDILGRRRCIPTSLLRTLFQSHTPAIRAATLRAVRFQPEVQLEALVIEALSSDSPLVASAAIETGLVLGLRPAWAACRRRFVEPTMVGYTSLLMLALGGDERDLELILDSVKLPASKRAAIWALGFSGRVRAAEVCLALVQGGDSTKVASEAFMAITGLPRTSAHLVTMPEELEELGPPTDEASAVDLVPGPEDALEVLEVNAVGQWWQTTRQSLGATARYLEGKPYTLGALHTALAQGRMRRRHVLALELAIHSRGMYQIDTRAWSSIQQEHLNEARSVEATEPLRHFDTMLSRSTPMRQASTGQIMAKVRRQGGESSVWASVPSAVVATGVGMISPLGNGAIESCAASRAGIRRIIELEDFEFIDPEDEEQEPEPAMGLCIPGVAHGFSGMGRLIRLGCAGLTDLMEGIAPGSWERTGLLVSLSSHCHQLEFQKRMAEDARTEGEEKEEQEEREEQEQFSLDDLRDGLTRRLLPALVKRTGVPVMPAFQRVFFGGQIGFIQALQAAQELLLTGRLERCIVGGIDSFVEHEALEALHYIGLLKTPSNPVGMLPGEGAAFVLLEASHNARRRKVIPRAFLESPSAQFESGGRFSQDPAVGRALARAINGTLEPLDDGGRRTGLIIGNLNGDAYRARDWGYAQIALRAKYPWMNMPEWHTGASFGELGAATGATAICMAVQAFERGYAGTRNILVWLAGDDGGRGALYLRSAC